MPGIFNMCHIQHGYHCIHSATYVQQDANSENYSGLCVKNELRAQERNSGLVEILNLDSLEVSK